MLNTLCFEQAFNELIRVCLKLEQLFYQVNLGLKLSEEYASRASIEALVNIANILDRPEFKGKLVKELNRVLLTISRLADSDKVDHATLRHIVNELEMLSEQMHSIKGKIGPGLRDNEFLASIRQHFNSIGGVSGFEIPAYWLWLQQPAHHRREDIQVWFEEVVSVQRTISLLLKLIRGSTIPQNRIANDGFYQMGLDPQAPLQLLQIHLPLHSHFFPETSIGRHGVSIRFYELNPQQKRRSQVTQDISFKISVCAL